MVEYNILLLLYACTINIVSHVRYMGGIRGPCLRLGIVATAATVNPFSRPELSGPCVAAAALASDTRHLAGADIIV